MKVFFALLLAFFTASVTAQTIITINSPYSPGHSGQVAFRLVLDSANQSQTKYKFILENKPGGEGVIALRNAENTPETTLSIITAAYVDLVNRGQIKEEDFYPVHGIGDFSWALVTNSPGVVNFESLKNMPEVVIGSPGIGNSIHLTGLAIGKKFNIPSILIPFKSANDGFVNMAGNHGVNLAFERISIVQQFSEKNPNLKIVAVSGNERNPAWPKIKSLAEQGINVPAPFNIVMAPKNMPRRTAEEIGLILDSATRAVGVNKLASISDIISPVFFTNKMTAQEFYTARIQAIRNSQKEFKDIINKSN